MWSRLILILAAGVLAACSGAPAQTPNPTGALTPAPSAAPGTPVASPAPTPTATPTGTPTGQPTLAVTPEPTIGYVCPYVTTDEITAITGRTVLEVRKQVDGLCSWILGSKPDGPVGETTFAWLRPWPPELTTDLFNQNYSGVPPGWREPGVGESAYWQTDVLNFLYQGQVYETEYDDSSMAEADLRHISVAIAKAAIPRL